MDIKKILQQLEGRRLEFKKELPSTSDLAKTIVSFANDAGGILYVGIKDTPREVVGVPEDDILKIEEQISNLIFDNCYPHIIPEISIINVEDKFVLKVQIYKGSNLPYYLKSKGKIKGTFIRVGSSNREATAEILAELERHRRNISFDSELIFEKAFSEIKIDSFKTFYKEKVKEELADVLAYAFLLAEKYGFDVKEILMEKIKKNGEKYPVEKAKGTAKKYNEL